MSIKAVDGIKIEIANYMKNEADKELLEDEDFKEYLSEYFIDVTGIVGNHRWWCPDLEKKMKEMLAHIPEIFERHVQRATEMYKKMTPDQKEKDKKLRRIRIPAGEGGEDGDTYE